jgi:hypothetical protein
MCTAMQYDAVLVGGLQYCVRVFECCIQVVTTNSTVLLIISTIALERSHIKAHVANAKVNCEAQRQHPLLPIVLRRLTLYST